MIDGAHCATGSSTCCRSRQVRGRGAAGKRERFFRARRPIRRDCCACRCALCATRWRWRVRACIPRYVAFGHMIVHTIDSMHSDHGRGNDKHNTTQTQAPRAKRRRSCCGGCTRRARFGANSSPTTRGSSWRRAALRAATSSRRAAAIRWCAAVAALWEVGVWRSDCSKSGLC